jgi:hypothetical protein
MVLVVMGKFMVNSTILSLVWGSWFGKYVQYVYTNMFDNERNWPIGFTMTNSCCWSEVAVGLWASVYFFFSLCTTNFKGINIIRINHEQNCWGFCFIPVQGHTKQLSAQVRNLCTRAKKGLLASTINEFVNFCLGLWAGDQYETYI